MSMLHKKEIFSKGYLLALSLIFVGFPSSVYSSPIRWEEAQGGNGHLYDVILVGSPISWNDARTAAQSTGLDWDLATITSAAESNFVKTLFSDNPSFFNTVPSGTNRSGPWIGAFDVLGSTNFQWVTGEAVTFTNWGPSEPFGNGQAVSYTDFTSPFGDGSGVAWNDIGPALRVDGPIAYLAETLSAPPSACIASGEISRISVNPGNLGSSFYVRASTPGSVSFLFGTTDSKIIGTVLKAQARHMRVTVTGSATSCGAVVGGSSAGGTVTRITLAP